MRESRFDHRTRGTFGEGAAQLLQEEGLPEFAASRAYYAMFYVAEAFLLADGLAFSSHKAVIAGFGKHFAKPGRVPVIFHRYLMDAQEDRATGDYGLLPEVTAEEADLHIERAHSLLNLAAASLA